ncbi:positive regulator of purine utilization [Paramyrothecium foliicola]|nr:positive regulator of purine utilization [Paramyrothecium foliicola]
MTAIDLEAFTMPTHGQPSPNPSPNPAKRLRQSSYEDQSPQNEEPSPVDHVGENGPAAALPAGKPGQSSSFRNVSACNRCRIRKNRCDQKLPSCASCAKAGVACVGYDPITKKEIPRSYVFYLETRVEQLENLLAANKIAFPPAENLELCSRQGADAASTASGDDPKYSTHSEAGEHGPAHSRSQALVGLDSKRSSQSPALLNIVSPTKPRSLASASGVSFARVVFAAVQYSVSDQASNGDRPALRQPAGNGTSMRDSFFGLHTKPTITPAKFPDKDVGLRLVNLYFEHANPQIPILHRGAFMRMFEQAYATPGQVQGARELYMLNMVFAIGCGVIVGEPVRSEGHDDVRTSQSSLKAQCQPEEYHASAIVHLESCLSSSGGGLEVLQAVLLLANFALLRPVPPGLWYIIGVAVRLAVDLGLHYEDGVDVDGMVSDPIAEPEQGETHALKDGGGEERGKRLWVRDMRRRLWWCTYSFDRLVSTCVGRPFGISDQVIITELPSLLDDDYITPTGLLEPPTQNQPSYKHVAHHYFRLRLLQSEILQVLQYNQTQVARAGGQSKIYPEMHYHLQSPFLVQFDSFRSWRIDIDRRLYQWKASAPTRQKTGVAFSTEFLELNYWQAIIMLYRQSLSVPAMFEGEYNTSHEVNSPAAFTAELREDEDRIYLKVAEAGQKILRIYRQLHLSGLVSYTYLSTHHLFMAGISYLYAIWHSPIVRSRLTMDEVDFTVLAAKSVFTDMIDKCPPAETCRDAFDRTAKATIKMATSTGGFGMAGQQRSRQRPEAPQWTAASDTMTKAKAHRGYSTDQPPFMVDVPVPDNASTSSMSISGDMIGQQASPSGTSKSFEAEGYTMRPQPRRSVSHHHEHVNQDTGRSIDSTSLGASPGQSRRGPPQQSAMGGPFISPPFGGQTSSIDFPDGQSMDFLQNLDGSSNGDFGNIDQAQLDLGFGMNWEGFSNDFGDGQQMNPFGTFFFGGPQGGNGSGL